MKLLSSKYECVCDYKDEQGLVNYSAFSMGSYGICVSQVQRGKGKTSFRGGGGGQDYFMGDGKARLIAPSKGGGLTSFKGGQMPLPPPPPPPPPPRKLKSYQKLTSYINKHELTRELLWRLGWLWGQRSAPRLPVVAKSTAASD